MSITQPVCVCVCSLRYPACNAHTLYCHLRPAPLCHIFPLYLTNSTIFERKKTLLNIKYVFWFCLKLLSETFLILRRNERAMIKKMYILLHVKCPLFLSDFNANPSSGSRVVPCERTDMTKLSRFYAILGTRPKKLILLTHYAGSYLGRWHTTKCSV